MLDTNIVSYIIRNSSAPLRKRLNGLSSSEEICISAITQAEIQYGLARRLQAHHLHSVAANALAMFVILPWDSAAAEVYGTLRSSNEAAGRSIGNLDMLIAAHAIAEGATLVTNDKAFSNSRVPCRSRTGP